MENGNKDKLPSSSYSKKSGRTIRTFQVLIFFKYVLIFSKITLNKKQRNEESFLLKALSSLWNFFKSFFFFRKLKKRNGRKGNSSHMLTFGK